MMAATRNTRDGHVPKYFYATGGRGRETVIYAYTQEAWGLGGSLPSGGNYRARTFTGLAIVALIATVPAILAPLFILVSVYAIITSFPDLGEMDTGLIWFVVSLVCTALFTGGWLLSLHALRGELKARKRRKDRGLPKPRYGVTDDQARRWFEDHPGALEITRENFPVSTRPFPGEPDYLPSHEKRA